MPLTRWKFLAQLKMVQTPAMQVGLACGMEQTCPSLPLHSPKIISRDLERNTKMYAPVSGVVRGTDAAPRGGGKRVALLAG